MCYNLIIEATTARFRAEYAPYDTRSEFDEGMKAYEAALAEPTRATDLCTCPYDGPGHAGYKVLAWEQGLECAVRLRFWFKYNRKLPVFGSG